MGHGSSRADASDDSSGDGHAHHHHSRFSRFRRRFRTNRHCHGSDPPLVKNLDADDFAGIARIEIISEKKLVLEKDGPTIARISVFEKFVGQLDRLYSINGNRSGSLELVESFHNQPNQQYLAILQGSAEGQESEDNVEELSLLDPSSSSTTVGSISILCYVEDPIETEKFFAHRILSVVDLNGDGKLSYSEFAELINAFGNQVATTKSEDLFKQADKNGDGVVDMDELATLIAVQQENEPLINNCPVCGESLGKFDKLNDMIHMTLCFDEGTGNQVMTGGFLTDKEASYGWIFKFSEWAHVSSYDIGVKDLLQNISEKQGKRMNSHESAKDIPQFIEFFKGQLKMDEAKYPIEYFKTFNEFFVRELKPGVRPIAYSERDDIAICAADCRLMAFSSANESLRFWIKDYHRFHVPVSGTIESFVDIPGYLYTVNPIAVNSKYCNVFTENKRVVSIISTSEFGKVAFVAIGATMVGSITFTKNEGDYVHKGDEFGYFSFGGSTVICVFEKDAIQIDEDLLSNSERSLETLVSVAWTRAPSSGPSLPVGSTRLVSYAYRVRATNPSRQREMERTSSIELEPRTLTYAELQHARVEAAMLILSSKSSEEAIKIFTEGVKPVACIRDKTYVNLVDNDDEEEEEDDDEMMDYFEMEQTYRPSF
ncbi:Phosphatidylserine decarboxylase [Musa troglodytarum]|uniref:Phosphatidylserine decarboxylase n=1 Tax=Musa troglodytarum TaxID=320322 RepID=A0A9E7I3U4_9LILI|nr:Phosphatidylserine decarboxylase [Musa troglodytarum]